MSIAEYIKSIIPQYILDRYGQLKYFLSHPRLSVKSKCRKFKYGDVSMQFILSDSDPLQRRAKKLSNKVFTGGPVSKFSQIGRLCLITLLKCGLTPESKVLDIGCGALRNGYWLIHFLNEGNYCGIEPNKTILKAGMMEVLSDGLIEQKHPRFSTNANFDFECFSERFDYFLARSVWTHASKPQIQTMLDQFLATTNEVAVFLTSYKKPFRSSDDYMGSEWVGKSHESSDNAVICHSLEWIEAECEKRNLSVRELPFDYYDQVWLHIQKQSTG